MNKYSRMKNVFKLFPLLAMGVVFSVAGVCRAQEKDAGRFAVEKAALYAGRKAAFRHITAEDGISGDQVKAVLQDRLGFIWIGTVSGLNRYDGYNFKPYYKDYENPNSLKANNIKSLYEDLMGNIWIVYEEGGFSSFDPVKETFTHYDRIVTSSGKTLPNIYASVGGDRMGNVWFGGQGNLLKRNPGTGDFEIFNYDKDSAGEPAPWFGKIHPDDSGNVWVFTKTGPGKFDTETGEYRWLKDESGYPAGLCGGLFRDMEIEAGGNLWIGCENSELVKYDPEKNEYTFHSPIKGGGPLMIDTYGNIWAGTSERGLYRLDPETGDIVNCRHSDGNTRSLSSDRITYLFEDLEGLIWVGTDIGLNIFNPALHQFTIYTKEPGEPNSLSDNNVLSVLKDESGILWVGTDGGGLNRFDRENWIWKSYTHDPADPESLSDNWVYGICGGGEDSIWVTTGVNLQRYRHESEGFENVELGTGGPDSGQGFIEVCMVDRKGMLWVGTRLGGVLRVDPETLEVTSYKFSEYDRNSLSHNTVKAIYEDSRGGIWVGAGEGLNRFDSKTGGFARYLHGRDPVAVNSIAQGVDGDLWLGTENGLCRFNPEIGACEYVERLVRREVVDDLQFDKEGNIWFSTKSGLAKYNIAYGSTVEFDYGLPVGKFSASYYDAESDEMLFGGMDGVVSFHPRKIRISSYLPTVLITRLSVNGKLIEPGGEGGMDKPVWLAGFSGDTIKLDPDENTITFEFSALSYASNQESRYRYILENAEENWHDVGGAGARIVTYPNLKPGKYTFRIKGSSGNGLWNERESTLNINISVLWWKTPLFRGGVFFILLLMGAGIYRLRVNAVVRRNALLENLVGERTKELREKNTMIAEQARIMGRLAKTDPLTGLANRRDFLERAEQERSRVERHGGCFSVILGDVDFFKKVNDTYGHDCGDYVLEKTAGILKKTLREQDIKARWGGEEFILLLPETDLQEAGKAAEKLRLAISAHHFEHEGQTIAVTMTFGVSSYSGEGNIEQCISLADEGLYTGKESGRNRVVLREKEG